MNFRRIWRLVKKELTQTRRDRKMIGILFFAPVFQLFVFGYAVTTDINHISMAVYDEDRTQTSGELVDRLVRSNYFDYKAYPTSPQAANASLDSGQAQMVLHIPRDFSKDLSLNRSAQVQVLLDGSDSMSARIISGYVTSVIQQYSSEITISRLDRLKGSLPQLPGITGNPRVWYNPELKSVNFMVPGVLCLVLLTTTITLTSLAIVKEK